jgi:hypothetical protein
MTDPWGVVVAAGSGGLAWAVFEGQPGPVGIVVGASVAAVVYGTRVGLGVLSGRGRKVKAGVDDEPELPAPRRRSAADRLLRRGISAADDLNEVLKRQPSSWVSEHLATVEAETSQVLTSLRRVAGRLAIVDAALERIDVDSLHAQRRELTAEDDSSPPGLRAERARAVAAIDAQLAAQARLQTTHSTLAARMQTAALGLEGVVTRVHEVLAAAEGAARPDSADAAIDDMQHDLDALREGLAEAEAIAKDDWGTAYGL